MTMTRRFALALMSACLAMPTAAYAQSTYPERPITLIVPWGAGGGTDATGRILAQLLQDKLGQPINVVNRTGGGSVIGHTEISRAKPDGYTLGIITTELSMFHWLGQSPLTYQDFSLVGLYNADPSAVIVSKDSPYKTLGDLVEALKKDPSAIRASGANQGGVNHLGYVGLVQAVGGDPAKAFWVPTEGAAPALQLLTSRAVDVVVVQPPEARALLEAGELRQLASLGTERAATYPDVPTVKEAIGVDFSFSGWRGLAGPKGMPEDVMKRLVEATAEVASSAAFKDFMTGRQYGVVWQGGSDFDGYLAARDKLFGDAMTAAGLAK